MILTERDNKVLDLIAYFRYASLSQIVRAYYNGHKQSYNLARRRLTKLVDAGYMKRERSNINAEYVYYMKKNNQMNHSLILTEFYIKLLETDAEVDAFFVEKPYGSMRPDAMVIAGWEDLTHYFFVEVHISNNPFNQQKYIDYYKSREWKRYFPLYPKIIILSDRRIDLQQPCELNIIQIDTKCLTLSEIWRV